MVQICQVCSTAHSNSLAETDSVIEEPCVSEDEVLEDEVLLHEDVSGVYTHIHTYT